MIHLDVYYSPATTASDEHEFADDDVAGVIELLREASRRHVEASGAAMGVSIELVMEKSKGCFDTRQADVALAGEKWALIVHDDRDYPCREWISVGSGPEGQIDALLRRTLPLFNSNFVDHAEVEPALVEWLTEGKLSERMQWAERPRPEKPSLAIDVLRPLVGRTLTRIWAYRSQPQRGGDYLGRFGGMSCAIEVDTGTIVRFGLLESVGCLSVFLERDARGHWYDEPPELDEDIRVVRATDATEGDPSFAAFEGLRIEEILLLHIDRRDTERGLVFDFGPPGAFVIGVGLERADGMSDNPVFLLPEDIHESLRGCLLRDPLVR